MVNLVLLKELIQRKVGTQLKLSERTGIENSKLSRIINGHIRPDEGEIAAMELVLGPEVKLVFNTFTDIDSSVKAQELLERLYGQVAELEANSDDTTIIKGNISKLEARLDELKVQEEKEAQRGKAEDETVKVLKERGMILQKEVNTMQGRITLLRDINALTEKLYLDYKSRLGRDEEIITKFKRELMEISGKIPAIEPAPGLANSYKKLHQIRDLLIKHEQESKNLQWKLVQAELAEDTNQVRLLKRELNNLAGIIDKLRESEVVIHSQIKKLEDEGFKARQNDISLEAEGIKGQIQAFTQAHEVLQSLAANVSKLWAKIKEEAGQINQKYREAQGKGLLLDMQNYVLDGLEIYSVPTKGQIVTHDDVTYIAQWLTRRFTEDTIRLMRERKGEIDIRYFTHAVKTLEALAQKYQR